jgi:membrane fusion protein, multidrug efflux system
MKKLVLMVVVVAAAAGFALYLGAFNRQSAQAADDQVADNRAAAGANAAGGRGRAAGRGGRGGAAGPLTVEVATASSGSVAQQLLVVGNLIGDATVAVVPRAAGRLEAISVRLGDPVRRGQRIAKIEDYELQEQVKQQEAGMEVSKATIRQREADLQLAQTNAERSRNLFARQLLPKQTFDDNEARLQAAEAQLDLARAQNTQSLARLDELKINLANTEITSPVNGFVARRGVDAGAFVGTNAPVVDVVDISRVRLVANIIEKDLKQVHIGDNTRVEVDAFPGEVFTGRIARLSPVLDPATRTAPMEIEIPNPGYRLKPGMYARVTITTAQKKNALVVPSNALVDYGGRRGVFVTAENDTVLFRPVRVGIEESDTVEIVEGVAEGDRVVTTGAGAVRDGDRVIVAGAAGGRRGGRNAAGGGSGRGGALSNDRTGVDTSGVAADRQFDGASRPGQGGSESFGGRRGRRGGQP